MATVLGCSLTSTSTKPMRDKLQYACWTVFIPHRFLLTNIRLKLCIVIIGLYTSSKPKLAVCSDRLFSEQDLVQFFAFITSGTLHMSGQLGRLTFAASSSWSAFLEAWTAAAASAFTVSPLR